ncbi:D-alanyl-D-alanine dipeptidase [Halioglobus japonicus]|nr:M15 family metallopeptidase [Halioglobus japonicus]GHD17184.1 D-alanyl-D-alanine dipeptidase [Halioglobus japonicus]
MPMRFLMTLLLLGASVKTIADEVLVNLIDYAPDIKTEIRYHGSDNFVGRRVDGYEAPQCLLTLPSAQALAAAQQELLSFGLSLRVYDCYRPQRAVDHFMRWTRDTSDTLQKARYYPTLAKSELVPKGYIAEQSGHSRGSTVDLTLVETASGQALDMGTEWDYFGPLSNTQNDTIRPKARANRLLLRSVMERHGFSNYPAEWWHFTLKNEPYPETYFDEPVR